MPKKSAIRNPKSAILKTRPDLDDQHWLAWVALQPENKGIETRDLYRKMLEWCNRKGVTPTRRRLLRWLDNEREDVPLTYQPPYSEGGNTTVRECAAFEPKPPCEICGKEICFNLHREERG